MYGRIATIRVVNNRTNERQDVILRSWADSLYHNPVYSTIRNQVVQRPGFISNSHALIDYQDNSATFITQIMFDSKENFLLYAEDPQTVSKWEMVTQFGKEAGLSVVYQETDHLYISSV
jgi:hypothetical protein